MPGTTSPASAIWQMAVSPSPRTGRRNGDGGLLVLVVKFFFLCGRGGVRHGGFCGAWMFWCAQTMVGGGESASCKRRPPGTAPPRKRAAGAGPPHLQGGG